MAGRLPSGKVLCTYTSCAGIFKSESDMKRHKTDHHDYCKRCDADFEDEERHLLHKIKSDKHIVCPVCGVDFRSEGGRDNHIRQNHRAEQHLVCIGCRATFKSASGLMRHVEQEECTEISRADLIQAQSRKLLIKEALRAGEGAPMPLIPNPGDFDDIDGGVKINTRELDNRQAMSNQPKRAGTDLTDSGHAILSTKHWPELREDKKTAAGDQSDLITFSEYSTPVKSSSGAWKGKERVVSAAKSEEETPPRTPGTFGFGMPSIGETLRIMDEHFDATKFFNSYTGEYQCSCGKTFGKMKDFEWHVFLKTNNRTTLQCPSCYRFFKSTAALVAHCESSSVRCKVNDGYRYGQLIDEISGGVIQTAGYNADGTVKYEAGKLEVLDTTTVGVDLKKVDW